jgi:hypothetical protein
VAPPLSPRRPAALWEGAALTPGAALRPSAALLLGMVVLMTGCARPSAEEALLGELKQRLAAREQHLAAYRVVGTVQDGGGVASFRFAFRAPDRMRGTVEGPVGRTFAFDGSTLFLREGEAGAVQAQPLAGLSRAEVAERLHAIFSHFVCAGFRAPLLAPQALRARRLTHPRAAQAVELVSAVPGPGGTPVTATYVLRWPAMDFLEKRLEGAGAPGAVRVEEEACPPGAGVCVPRVWTHWSDGQRVATVRLSEVALGEALPQEVFSLAPAGAQGL